MALAEHPRSCTCTDVLGVTQWVSAGGQLVAGPSQDPPCASGTGSCLWHGSQPSCTSTSTPTPVACTVPIGFEQARCVCQLIWEEGCPSPTHTQLHCVPPPPPAVASPPPAPAELAPPPPSPPPAVPCTSDEECLAYPAAPYCRRSFADYEKRCRPAAQPGEYCPIWPADYLTDGWTDGRTDGRTDSQITYYLLTCLLT